jgi:hypothetical protein
MRVVCLVLALMLWTGQARAETTACYPPAALIHGILLQGFLPTVEIEIEKKPGIIFTNDRGDWVVFALVGDFMCEVAHGRAWNEVRRRGA